MKKVKTTFQNEVINRVRQLRISKNVSQPQLAQILMMSNGQIGNIESINYPHKYTIKQLVAIAEYFHVPIMFLFTGTSTGQESINDIINLIIQYDE